MTIPTATVPFTEIDGIPCYAPEAARTHADYPSEGFAVTAAVEARSFWCRSRIRIIRGIIERYADRLTGETVQVLEIRTLRVLVCASGPSSCRPRFISSAM